MHNEIEEGFEVDWAFAIEQGFFDFRVIPDDLREWLCVMLDELIEVGYFSNFQFID